MEISQKTGRGSFYFRWNTKIPLPLNGKRQAMELTFRTLKACKQIFRVTRLKVNIRKNKVIHILYSM